MIYSQARPLANEPADLPPWLVGELLTEPCATCGTVPCREQCRRLPDGGSGSRTWSAFEWSCPTCGCRVVYRRAHKSLRETS